MGRSGTTGTTETVGSETEGIGVTVGIGVTGVTGVTGATVVSVSRLWDLAAGEAAVLGLVVVQTPTTMPLWTR